MNFDLEKFNFNVLSCTDLSMITAGPTTLYKLFQNLYKEEFAVNDRICFYTNYRIPESLWKHLYQAANQIDISNFFITIISSKDVSAESTEQALKWSVDPVPFGTLQIDNVESEPLTNNYIVPDTICPLPWMHLEIKNDSTVRPCCVFKGSVGNVENNSLTEIFYNQSMAGLRSEFLSGKMPVGCNVCWKNEELNVVSNRQRHLNLLRTKLLTNYLDDPKISSLDLKPGNTCNFKCRICGPESSSLWAKEIKINSTSNVQHRSFNWATDREQIFNEIIECSDNLINVDMYGGEPFLIKPLTGLVEKLVAQEKAHNIRLHYNTNGSIWPENLISLWPHFLHVDLHVSIDNIGQRFELERGGSWQDIEQNIKKFKELNFSNLKISIMPVINIMNVLYIDELFSWAKDIDLSVNPLYLQHPGHLSIENLTADAKNLVLTKYSNSNHPEIKKIIKIIQNSKNGDGIDFIKYMKKLDQIRNESFLDSHKDIAKAMGYII